MEELDEIKDAYLDDERYSSLLTRVEYLIEKQEKTENRVKVLENHIVSTSKEISFYLIPEYYPSPSKDSNTNSKTEITGKMESDKNIKEVLIDIPAEISNLEHLNNDEVVNLNQFLKRILLIAYACFRHPFKGDVYIDFKTNKLQLIK